LSKKSARIRAAPGKNPTGLAGIIVVGFLKTVAKVFIS
jgi:hypothetical protein